MFRCRWLGQTLHESRCSGPQSVQRAVFRNLGDITLGLNLHSAQFGKEEPKEHFLEIGRVFAELVASV
jgi:hypothetical protein